MGEVLTIDNIPHPKFNLKSPNWPDGILIIILTLLPLLFFWRLMTPNLTDRMQIAGGDFGEQYFPLRAFTAQEWVKGRIPLWNPYLYGGQPALADIQAGALYPPHVIEALILGWGGPLIGREIGFPVWALELQAIFHFSIAAVGAYLFTRHLGRQGGLPLHRARFGGVIASLIFTYGGYLTGFPVQQITILEASAWLPWVLWGVSVGGGRGAEERRSGGREERGSRGAGEQGSGGVEEGRSGGAEEQETAITHHAATGRQASRITPPQVRKRHASRFTFFVIRFTPSLRPAAWSALAFALAILAGHPQTVLYIFYLSLAYALFLSLLAWRQSKHSQFTILSPLLTWFIAIFLGSLIAAAQILPTLEFITLSLRADLSYQAVSAGLPLNEFISILYPGFFGGSPEYVGIVALVLIALALVVAWPRSDKLRQPKKITSTRSVQPSIPHSSLPPLLPSSTPPLPRSLFPHLLFWTTASLISLLLAFGGGTFLYSFFYLLMPGFEAVRQQERVLLIYSFSAAILAGYGAMILAGPFSKAVRPTYALFERRLRLVAGFFLGLTALFIYGSTATTARGDEVNLFFGVLRHHLFGLIILAGLLIWLALRPRRWVRRTWGMGLLALWTAFNLFTVNWRFNLQEPEEPPPFTPNGVVQFLQSNFPVSPLPNLPSSRIASGGLLPGGNSAASVYELQDLTGNTPLQLAAVDAFLRQMPSWRLWQLMNVRYVVDNRDISGDGLSLVFEEGADSVFEMGDPFPRAWFVSQVEVIGEADRAMARLAADDFDLRRTAVVDSPVEAVLTDAGMAKIDLINLTPTSLGAAVEATGHHLLIFSQIDYPGWQAQIDGQAVRVRRVNVVQQGILVPPGSHTVELQFSPASFWWGAVISLAGVFLWLVLLLKSRT